ncbi:MAG: phosphoadenosine phosphosulfate reductase family protein [Butyrivibrio sp.]|nr:phosphoadenosine phosphosulfate reductase family protein [Acetatifactor muris]MCM1561461.1 phosphoadenosine phosphosulfate reductase family protein [Butyrivibrio sp.]
MSAVYTFREVNEEQKKDLDYKIDSAVRAIRRAFDVSKSAVALAFSGGKDSTVLWHLVRTYFPDAVYHVIFGNTTVEFPESLAFARKLGKEWSSDKVHFHEVLPDRLEEDGLKYEAQTETLEWLIREGRIGEVLKDDGKLKSTRTLEMAATPEMWESFRERNLVWKKGTMKSFVWCCDQYGYPILGKAASKLTARRINIDCFLQFSDSSSEKEETLEYYNLLRHVKTSNHCCSILKKEPSEKKQAELGIDVVMKGLMAEESHSRLLSFATRGYLFKSSRPHTPEFYHCSPLGIWTDADIWTYIEKYNVPYSPLYDLTYVNRKYEGCYVKRNGCVGCCTDIAFPDNHMSVLRQTHPELWRHYMKSGLGEQLMKLEEYKNNGQISFLNIADTVDDVLDSRPCAFDRINERITEDEITKSSYDSEIDGQLSLDL